MAKVTVKEAGVGDQMRARKNEVEVFVWCRGVCLFGLIVSFVS